MRLAALLALLTVSLGSPPSRVPAPPDPVPHAGSGYQLPLAGSPSVLRGFVAPQSRFGPGHRGVDLAAGERQAVYAAGAGTVAFAGPVAGRGVVVLKHRDGVRTEYEPVAVLVHAGQHVERGQVIATVHGDHRSCPSGGCLHWGARRGEVYFDPMLLLERLGPVRLLPLTGPSGARVGLGVGLP